MSDTQPEQKVCPRCDGTGKNKENSKLGWPGSPCFVCLGTGKVTEGIPNADSVSIAEKMDTNSSITEYDKGYRDGESSATADFMCQFDEQLNLHIEGPTDAVNNVIALLDERYRQGQRDGNKQTWCFEADCNCPCLSCKQSKHCYMGNAPKGQTNGEGFTMRKAEPKLMIPVTPPSQSESELEGLRENVLSMIGRADRPAAEADLDAYIAQRERAAFIQGRNIEIEILGYTEGCNCMTCKEVMLKTNRLTRGDK